MKLPVIAQPRKMWHVESILMTLIPEATECTVKLKKQITVQKTAHRTRLVWI